MSESPQPPSSRRDLVFFALAGIFITHALLGELLGGKLFAAWGWVMSIGVIPWPVVFVTTDLVNEYYGPKAVRRLTLLAIALFIDTFVINSIAFGLPGKITPGEVLELSVTNYAYKFLIALATLPVIYFGHSVLDRYFARDPER